MVPSLLLLVASLVPTAQAIPSIDKSTPQWQCDIRAWTRAPDLYPGATVPAEARLALNGTECGMVQSWAVGLRLRERAVIKKRAKDSVALPPKPKSRWDSDNTLAEESDWNSIYHPFSNYWHDDGENEDFRKAWKEYENSIRNQSLWDVNGMERIVFDLQQPLPFHPLASDQLEMDLVQAFHVQVPLTNFPPSEWYGGGFELRGSDQQMYASENQFEYYHNVTLSNGTVIDIPAGSVGFLPSAHMAVVSGQTRRAEEGRDDGSIELDLSSPFTVRKESLDDEDDARGWTFERPACDQGHAAAFHISVTPASGAVQSQNVTLDITITRTGNGTEYPVFLDVATSMRHDMEWARSLFEDEDDFQTFAARPQGRDVECIDLGGRSSQMLMVEPKAVLEERRAREKMGRREDMYWAGPAWDSRSPRHGARYDFEENRDGEEDFHRIQLELPISYAAMPSFTRTLDSIQSMLEISLITKFTCAEDRSSEMALLGARGPHQYRGPLPRTIARDVEWNEFTLPPLKDDTSSEPRRSRTGYYRHKGRSAFDISPSAKEISSEDSLQVKHYTDPTALAPRLYLSATTQPAFKALGNRLRQENKDEMLIRRYYVSDDRRQQGWCKHSAFVEGCWELNGGGGGMHAAKLWQALEERQKEQASHENLAPHGFVVQA